MMNKFTFIIVSLILLSQQAIAQLKAFPEAEGFGAYATGGRGGDVIKVTNLDSDGRGSLQWALNQRGPRIIVFAVSGVIVGDVHIPHGDVTIAGQTAPGAGITIAGHLYSTYGDVTSNIILRHIRVRPPGPNQEWPQTQHDGIQLSTGHTFMLDHVDVSHGADENIDFWGGSHHITVQWSNISFPIYDPSAGLDTNRGLLNHRPCLDEGRCSSRSLPGGFISIHHNLFIHNRNRTPALSIGPADVRNNVIYNGREGFVHHNSVDGQFNIIGNKYIDGPSAELAPFWFDPSNRGDEIPSEYWMEDNLVLDPGIYEGVVDNPYDDFRFDSIYYLECCSIVPTQFNQSAEFDFSEQDDLKPFTHTSAEIEQVLIDYAGAFPRDIVASISLEDLQTRSGRWGINRPGDLMEGLTAGTPPLDTDNDGMPNSWEEANGLDPRDGDDYNTIMPSSYTAIEEYINTLATQLVGM